MDYRISKFLASSIDLFSLILWAIFSRMVSQSPAAGVWARDGESGVSPLVFCFLRLRKWFPPSTLSLALGRVRIAVISLTLSLTSFEMSTSRSNGYRLLQNGLALGRAQGGSVSRRHFSVPDLWGWPRLPGKRQREQRSRGLHGRVFPARGDVTQQRIRGLHGFLRTNRCFRNG